MLPELVPLPSAVTGARVRVRPFRRGDGDAVFQAIDEDRAHLRAWLPWVDAHKSPLDTEVYVRKASAWWILREDLPLLVETIDGAVLGGSGLHRFDWASRSFEIGYWIRKAAEGRGYVSDAVKLAAAIAFERLDAARVEIRCDVANVRSASVPRRLGFIAEGTVRTTHDDGAPRDMLVFSLSPAAYRALGWHGEASRAVEAADREG